jgi:hypothetical protein
MHVGQLVLVSAENIDITNRDEVNRYTEMQLSNDDQVTDNWWDWCSVGGRWEDYLKETISSMIWPNQLDSPVALKLTRDNWPMAIKLLEKAIEQRAMAVVEYVSQLKALNIDLNEYILNFEPLPKDKDSTWVPYYIRNIFSIKHGDWGPESAYVDTTNWMNASPERLLDYLKNPTMADDDWDEQIENYALVVVDFHH